MFVDVNSHFGTSFGFRLVDVVEHLFIFEFFDKPTTSSTMQVSLRRSTRPLTVCQKRK